jgi:hypothetical protein
MSAVAAQDMVYGSSLPNNEMGTQARRKAAK